MKGLLGNQAIGEEDDEDDDEEETKPKVNVVIFLEKEEK